MSIKKTASATWQGDLKSGTGHISTESGALDDQPFGFNTRFEGKAGTNPEELIGGALAGCFAMALSVALGEHDIVADDIATKVIVHLSEKDGGGFEIPRVDLDVTVTAPGADQAKVEAAFEATKKDCPVSNALAMAKAITLHFG